MAVTIKPKTTPQGMPTKRKRRSLPGEVRALIVMLNARFRKPSEIQKIVKERFGIAVSAPEIARYDLDQVNGQKMSAEHKALFEREREKLADEYDQQYLAYGPERLRQLQRVYEGVLDGSIAPTKAKAAAILLENARREMVEFDPVIGDVTARDVSRDAED